MSAFSALATASTAEGSTVDAVRARLGQAEALLRGGHLDDAVASLKTLSAARDKMTPPLQVEMLRIDAIVDLARGLDATAREAVSKARQLMISSHTLPDPASFAMDMVESELLDRQGDAGQGALVAAGRALGEARRNSISPDRSSKVGRALLLRARLLSQAGRSDDSRYDAASAAKQLEATLGPENAETIAARKIAARPDLRGMTSVPSANGSRVGFHQTQTLPSALKSLDVTMRGERCEVPARRQRRVAGRAVLQLSTSDRRQATARGPKRTGHGNMSSATRR